MLHIMMRSDLTAQKEEKKNITFSFLLQIKIKVVVAEEIISKVMNTNTANISLLWSSIYFLGGMRGTVLIAKVRLRLGLMVLSFFLRF